MADGRLADNVLHFARILRAAGLPIGTGQILDGARALEIAGLRSRDDVYWALHAVFITRHEQSAVFDSAFGLFWRDLGSTSLSKSESLPQSRNAPHLERRLARLLLAQNKANGVTFEGNECLSFSSFEILRKKDFEQMSVEEWDDARRALRCIRIDGRPASTRRYRAARRGRVIDLRASLRASFKSGGEIIDLKRRLRVTRPPALVVLCDISGSMSRYSRMLLHFLHALANNRDRVHAFVFGTRLTNVTRYLRDSDVDRAVEKISAAVEDWGGGTRIGLALHDFNRFWSRRILAQGAIVLLVTDGLDRDAGSGLGQEMDRLNRSCQRLIWLNPLLRFEGFEAKALGIRAMLPYVDEFRPVHSLDSIMHLAEALSATPKRIIAA